MEPYDMKDTAHWPNVCDHTDDEFVGSGSFVDRVDGVLKEQWIDVYVWSNLYVGGRSEVCVRYGEESHEYISAGGVIEFLSVVVRDKIPMYRHACDILKRKGVFGWTRKECADG